MDREIIREAILEIVENQISGNDPPETRETYERLQGLGYSEEDARIYISRAVVVEIWNVLHENEPFNHERFLNNLRNLPKEPDQ